MLIIFLTFCILGANGRIDTGSIPYNPGVFLPFSRFAFQTSGDDCLKFMKAYYFRRENFYFMLVFEFPHW